MSGTETHRGSCLCGAACLCGAGRFTVGVALPPPDACHGRECRKRSGHVFASTAVSKSAAATRLAKRIFVAERGDCYGIADELPRHSG